MNTRPLRFVRRGQLVRLAHVPPERTLLDLLREDLAQTGTKEGCGEGDCGACTVVLAELHEGRLRYRAVNSCIRLVHSIDGLALWTVEDLTRDPLLRRACAAADPQTEARGDACSPEHPAHPIAAAAAPGAQGAVGAASSADLHPVQQALLECHGSQCGFCTPGFVMSLFGLYQNKIAARATGHAGYAGQEVTQEQALEALSGNLCRCTGYRPILQAAQRMGTLPAVAVEEAELLRLLKLLAQEDKGLEGNFAYESPQTLPALLAARAARPEAQVVAGCTDVSLWVTQQQRRFAQVLDVTRVSELRRIDWHAHHIAIGAAVTLTDAFAALAQQWPQLHDFGARFAGLPVRNAGTLGGNVANGSPIGDSMPLLIALGAQLVLASTRGERTFALEDFYTGYRRTQLAPDELLVRILVPRPPAASSAPGAHNSHGAPGAQDAPGAPGAAPHTAQLLRAYKVSKRWEDDISAVCLALQVEVAEGVVQRVRIGAGGVAATPARARATEAALLGQPWTQATLDAAAHALQAEFTPLSDLRATSSYRRAVLGRLLQRFWLESQPEHQEENGPQCPPHLHQQLPSLEHHYLPPLLQEVAQ
ncbi:xanthine dehydrogenase small subunit [Extensimonas sp. H3M7-6]|uniref:xanthine dehydrogenase small subunit n=1 Tax=Extensimonas soli TaxID=3031322 RepID=UPI0023DC7330|nr:FAD binding domain-containing protein [Extensimonas sp. H3M7-6]MDF1480967.1 FAD binding domain-containing protein [Extensimonas sp. H3M7-6]